METEHFQPEGLKTASQLLTWFLPFPLLLSLLLRFWVNTLKNPQFIFDVRVSDNVDANLTVIAQTFIDACTTAEHKVGRVSLYICTCLKVTPISDQDQKRTGSACLDPFP